MEKIILASQSPRRQEILTLGGYEYEVRVSHAEEKMRPEECAGLSPEQLVQKLAQVKAEDVCMREDFGEDVVVIGADTVVSVDGCVLGKPADEAEAVSMLTRLAGREHEVFTGVCILWKSADTAREISGNLFSCRTGVEFYPMRPEEIRAYVATGDCMDKAGAYGIQSGAAKYIRGIHGDYLNVVGLPLSKIYHVLDQKIPNLTIKK